MSKIDKVLAKIFKKKVGDLTMPELRELLIYFKLIGEDEVLTIKFVPIKPKKRKKKK